MIADAALAAMQDRTEVHSETGIVGRIDELYISVFDAERLRARVCDFLGRVHHFDIERLEPFSR